MHPVLEDLICDMSEIDKEIKTHIALVTYVNRNADILHDSLAVHPVVGAVQRNDVTVLDLRDADVDERRFLEATDEDLFKRSTRTCTCQVDETQREQSTSVFSCQCKRDIHHR